MVDPAIDDPARPWCYIAKSTTLIGVPYMPDAVQVTFDGAIYTRQAELCFFYGDPLRPVMARQKTYLDGWIPAVVYDWRDGAIACDVEMFGAVLDGEDESNTVQFARVRLRNTGQKPARAVFAAATRCTGGDGRFGGGQFSPVWRYEMTDDSVLRDGKLIYTFPPGLGREAVPGRAYEQAFPGAKHHVTRRAAVCMVRFDKTLAPGQTETLIFKMPRAGVPTGQKDLVAKIRSADYDVYREKTVRFWNGMLADVCRLSIPEKRVEHAHRACVVHTMLATRLRGGERFQTDGLPYPNLFLLCLSDYQMLYDSVAQRGFVESNLPQYASRQLADGLFLDTSLIHGKRILSSHGPALQSLAHHYVMTRDAKYARKVWPMIRKAVACIRKDHESDPRGLMRPSTPYDAEMIKGYYTSHNLWCLLALRTSIRVARALGETADAADWTKLHESYQAAVLKAIDASAKDDGYVPTGLYDFITGPAARRGMGEYQTDQDWENVLLAWPTEVLAPGDPRVAGTCRRLRRTKFREGIMTYRNGQHLHQYLTVKTVMQDLVRGDPAETLAGLYHVLLHSGSTHEGYENLIAPWGDRIPHGCPPPHAWGAAKIGLMIRCLLVREHGGRAGLDEGRRDLHLFSVISPAWAGPGREVAVRNAPTEMGPVWAVMKFTDGGAEVTVQCKFHHPPRHVVIPVPYFVELTGYESDAKESKRDGSSIRLSPDVTRLQLKWKPRPAAHAGTFQELLLRYRREVGHWRGRRDQMPTPPKGLLSDDEKRLSPQPLSFALIRRAYQHEYARRYRQYLQAGGKPIPIHAPPPLTAEQRKTSFVAQYGTMELAPGIAAGKPASASGVHLGYVPAKAVDGNCFDLQSSWQAAPYPQWLKIDLTKPTKIDRIHVWPYWGAGRFYRYTVEVSLDGKDWTRVADLSRNRRPATPKGDDHRFPARQARYVRVNMLYHSLNEGVHLVEVRIFAPARPAGPKPAGS